MKTRTAHAFARNGLSFGVALAVLAAAAYANLFLYRNLGLGSHKYYFDYLTGEADPAAALLGPAAAPATTGPALPPPVFGEDQPERYAVFFGTSMTRRSIRPDAVDERFALLNLDPVNMARGSTPIDRIPDFALALAESADLGLVVAEWALPTTSDFVLLQREVKWNVVRSVWNSPVFDPSIWTVRQLMGPSMPYRSEAELRGQLVQQVRADFESRAREESLGWHPEDRMDWYPFSAHWARQTGSPDFVDSDDGMLETFAIAATAVRSMRDRLAARGIELVLYIPPIDATWREPSGADAARIPNLARTVAASREAVRLVSGIHGITVIDASAAVPARRGDEDSTYRDEIHVTEPVAAPLSERVADLLIPWLADAERRPVFLSVEPL